MAGEVQGATATPEIQCGKVTVQVSSDKMAASLLFEIAKGEYIPTEQMIRDAIAIAGITYGIDEAAIKTAVKSGRTIVVARGLEAVDGQDGHIIRKFDIGERGKPKAIEYDRVDYKDMNLFTLAKKDELLAEIVPETEGKEGVDVYGKPIGVKKGKPVQFKVGKNTYLKDERFLYADLDGQIVDTEKSISVNPHLQITEDVSVGTGNINFTGAVSIKGNVDTGFVVKATGDIEISGMVTGAEIEGENIFVKGGVQGMNRGRIYARGNFSATFVENADIVAEQDVTILDVALHSQLQAGHKLYVQGKRGQLVGGTSAAGESIEAKQIGNKSNVATILQVGINPMLQKKYNEAIKAYGEAKKRLDQVKKTLNAFANVDRSKLPEQRQSQLEALSKSSVQLKATMRESDELIAELEDEIAAMKKGVVRVSDTLYPGVKLKINNIIKNIQTEEKHCSLKVDAENTIRVGVY